MTVPFHEALAFEEALKCIVEDNTFEVKFIKKDGSERKMKCSFNFGDKIKGKSKDGYHQSLYQGNIIVVDEEKDAIRSVNLSTLQEITINFKKKKETKK